MKKTRAIVMLALLGIATLVFSFGAVLPSISGIISNINVDAAGSRFSPAVEKRFAFLEPVWDDTQWYAQTGKGSYKLSSSHDQYFNLQSRYFNKVDVAVNPGKDITNSDDATKVLPVFSSSDMNAITNGTEKKFVQDEERDINGNITKQGIDNAAFVMLDNDATEYDNRVVLEFKNLSGIYSLSGSRQGMKETDKNNILAVVNSGTESLDQTSAEDKIYYTRTSVGQYEIRGVFEKEGYYEFTFSVIVRGTNADRIIALNFGFYIGHADQYVNSICDVHGYDYTQGCEEGCASNKVMPVFDLKADGHPVLNGLVRPSQKTSIVPINNDHFYYNFQDKFPSVEYRKSRYEVSVSMTDHNRLPQTVALGGTSDYPKYEFSQLGMYTVNADMLFPVAGRNKPVRVPNFASHRYYLDIFGFQAQYLDFNSGSYKWFGGEDTRSVPAKKVNSDITNAFKTDTSIDIYKNDADKGDKADAAIKSLVGKLSGNPVVTNSPPVSLRYNVSHAFADEERKEVLSRVAYRKTYASEWDVLRDDGVRTPYGNNLFSDYVVGKPFEQAGEYAVIVYYEYNATEEGNKIYSQVFYFRIEDFASDVKLEVGGTSYSFVELMGQKLQASQQMSVVYQDGSTGSYYGNVGPFEIKPIVEVEYNNFARNSFLGPIDPTVIPRPSWFGQDGIYTFRVYYGNNKSKTHMPHMDFTVVLDSSPIKNFSCYQGNNTNNKGIKSDGTKGEWASGLSLFGGGDVTLAWEKKESGVDMVSARLEFYEFKIGAAVYSDEVDATVLQSQFEVQAVVSRSLRIISTSNGFKLADKLTASGLYKITILDAAGVETSYIIVIDTTVANFAQDEVVDPSEVNIKGENTTVGFGKHKLIVDKGGHLNLLASKLGTLFDSYSKKNNEVIRGIKIPVVSTEMSIDGVNYSALSGNKKALTVQDKSVTYFFRLYDLTGNVAQHYVELNSDPTKGIIFEDSVSNIFDGAISLSATIIQSGMISKRDYITFSFMQAPRLVGDNDWHVDKINIAYYPLVFQRESLRQKVDANGDPVLDVNKDPVFETVTNKNYPFSDTAEVFEDVSEVGSTDTAGRMAINITRSPKTKQGLYVIARICDNAPGGQDIRHYYFIADNNSVISNQNFESGIIIEFGSGPTQKTASYNDFQKINNARMDPERDRVLRSNGQANVLLPGSISGNVGAKYGRTKANDMADTFTVLTGDLLSPLNVTDGKNGRASPIKFSSLNLTKSVEYRAPGADTFVEQKINQSAALTLYNSGLYRVAFTDGSGGYSWILGAEAPKPLDGNRSEILVEIINQGAQGTFALNGRQISQSSYYTSENDRGNYHSVRVGDKANDRLTFSFVVEDTSNFLQPIITLNTRVEVKHADGTSHSAELVQRSQNEETNKMALLSRKAVYSEYTAGSAKYCEITLPLSASSVSLGDTFQVTLDNGIKTRRLDLMLDNTPPMNNWDRVISGDKFFRDNRASIVKYDAGLSTQKQNGTVAVDSGDSLKYPFAIDKNFRFEKAGGIYTFDTYSISYFEVDSRLSTISGERFFDYNGDTFWNIVGMKSEQNRFFRIVERDEAGNSANYYVQLRGDAYVDRIEASGIIEYRKDSQNRERPTGNQITTNLISEGGIIRGYEITVGNLRDFFSNNLFFEISAGNYSIKRLGNDSMLVRSGASTVVMNATSELFSVQIQKMVTAGQGDGTGGAIRFNLNSRFKSFGWDIRQFTRTSGMFEIEEEDYGANNLDMTFRVKDSQVSNGLAGNSFYIFDVYNLSDLSAGPITARTVSGARAVYIEDKNNEYLIVATDEFGRVAKYAHNGIYGSKIDFRYAASMSGYVGKDLYVGSGVEVMYSGNAYDMEIYKDGVLVYRNGVLLDTALTDYIVFNTLNDTTVKLLPEEGKISNWKVVGYRRGTGIIWERKFYLYGELPVLHFKNQGGEEIVDLGNGRMASGIVAVSYSTDGLLFGASVVYSRTYVDSRGNERTDWHAVSEFATRFNLTLVGNYTFIVTNALGFSSSLTRYTFTIDDVTNKHYKVFMNYVSGEVELEASPVVYDGYASAKGLRNYLVRGNNLSGLRIVPTTNGNWGKNAEYVTTIGNTTIYCLRSTTTQSAIYFAVTLIVENAFGSFDGVLPLSITTAGGIQPDSVLSDSRYRTYYQLENAYQPNATITVGLLSTYLVAQQNILYVDYYRDGSYAGTIKGSEQLVIYARDYGVYTFKVYDHAGYVRKFDSEDHYTVINLCRAPLYITENGAKSSHIIDGMVYNDGVSLNVAELPFDAFSGNQTYARRMVVYHNGVLRTDLGYEATNKAQAWTSFAFGESGSYRVLFSYRFELPGARYIINNEHEYNFTIVSSVTPRQSFSFVGLQNMEITSVKLNKNEIRTKFADPFLRQLSISTSTGVGEYLVTVKMGADNIYQFARTKTFAFVIRSISRVDVYSTIDYGTSTTSGVELSINPRMLYNAYEDCRVVVIRNGIVVADISVGPMGGIGAVNENYSIASVTDVGQYRVYVTSLDSTISSSGEIIGTVHYSQGFEITKAQNPLGMIIIIVLLVVAALAVFFFIRLRTGMRVK